MFAYRLRAAGLAVAASLGLSACATDMGYGYSGVSVGIAFHTIIRVPYQPRS